MNITITLLNNLLISCHKNCCILTIVGQVVLTSEVGKHVYLFVANRIP